MFSDFLIDAEVSHGPPSNRESENLLFTGDLYFGHDFWKDDPFSRLLKEKVRDAECAVTNLEGTFNTGEPIAKQGPNLSIEESTIETIANSGFDAVSLANNHAMDYGPEGLTAMQSTVRETDLESFGAGADLGAALDPVTVTCGGATVGIFGLSENQEGTADENTPGVAWAYEPNIGSRLQRRVEEFNVSVLVAHGGVEYVPIPPRSWRRFLRSCTDLGFDLILGHHPHTPQGWEWYQETPIFYSLGNFAMYRPNYPSTHWSYILDVDVNEKSVSGIRVILTTVSEGKIKIINPDSVPDETNYLKKSSEIVSDDQLFEPHWQTVATRVYRDIYHRQLKVYGLGTIMKLLSDPFRELDQLTRRVTGIPAQDSHLAFKEYIQNPSHRDVIRTTLSLETGAVSDQRTNETTTTIQKLCEQSDGRQNKQGVEKHIWRLKTAAKRFSRAYQ
jgi:poly-gamma-glutamate synthesis protein (capsule biosynthesis protein)